MKFCINCKYAANFFGAVPRRCVNENNTKLDLVSGMNDPFLIIYEFRSKICRKEAKYFEQKE